MAFLNLSEVPTHELLPKHPTKQQNLGAKAPTLSEQPPPPTVTRPDRRRPTNADRLAIRPAARILQQLREYSAETNRSMTSVIEVALLDYFDTHAPKRGRLGAKAPLSNKDLRKGIRNLSSIARLYQFWTAAYNAHSKHYRTAWLPTWTDRDYVCEEELRGYDERSIELSIIRTVSTKKLGEQRIVSFRYYMPQIFDDYDRQTTTLEKKLDWMLDHYREKVAHYLKADFQPHWNHCPCGHHKGEI